MKSFITAIETDAEFNDEIHSLLRDGKITEVVEAAAKKGYTITEADLREHLEGNGAKVGRKASEVLTEEALENVAGGESSLFQPRISETCWFMTGFTGAKGCIRFSCKAQVIIGFGRTEWYQCSCYGTSNCVDGQHHTNSACK